jgi:hypothetical protein
MLRVSFARRELNNAVDKESYSGVRYNSRHEKRPRLDSVDQMPLPYSRMIESAPPPLYAYEPSRYLTPYGDDARSPFFFFFFFFFVCLFVCLLSSSYQHQLLHCRVLVMLTL